MSLPFRDEATSAYSIVREDADDCPLLRLGGDMDLEAAADLREALLRALSEGDGEVALDLSDLSFLDSTIISVLIMAKRRADLSGGSVRLRQVPERTLRVLAITGIDSLFVIEEAGS